MTAHDLVPFISSLALGLLIGFERERSHQAEVRQAAGSRTFALLALGGTLSATFGRGAVTVGMLVVGALLVSAYRATSGPDAGSTTEVAAFGTFLLGALTWTQTSLAVTLAIVVVALLAAKTRIHRFARSVVTDVEVEDAVKFLVMAFVVLPLLPNRGVGPYGVLNPERIWQLVLALTGISWAGYIATRALGPRGGPIVAGLAGGFISASATTASMGRLARSTGAGGTALAGAYLASVATFIQLAGIVAVADRDLLIHLWPALGAGAVVLVAVALVTGLRSRGSTPSIGADEDPSDGSDHVPARPFEIRPALVLAAVLTASLLLSRWIVDIAGARATTFASGAAGLADAHAGALAAATLHHQQQIGMATALLSVGAAVLTNTVIKCVLAFVTGGRTFGLRFLLGVLPAFGAFGAVVAASAAAT